MTYVFEGIINKGIAWAASKIPGAKVCGNTVTLNGRAIVLKPAALGNSLDDFCVSKKDGQYIISGHTQAAICFGLLELAERLGGKRPLNVKHNFPFNTRNYKLEVSFTENERRFPITKYTPEFWDSFCRKLLEHRFNGLVIYPGTYHPFENLLDYREYAKLPLLSREERAANLEALNLGLKTAKEYGLRTFLQNYILGFTPAVAAFFKLPFYKEGDKDVARGRLSDDKIAAYWKYCYRRLFELCPDLSGLYMNYESSGDAFDFIKATAVSALNAMEKKPILMHRIWSTSAPEKLAGVIKAYRGKSMFSHKITDSADSYIYPTADSRLAEWKKYMPGVEAMYLVGPCHNCGNNIDRVLWTDEDYLNAIIRDAKKKGADSISFHTVMDPLASYLPSKGIIKDVSENLGWLCYFHMKTVADAISGRTPGVKERVAQYAEHFGVSLETASKLRSLIGVSSKIVPLLHVQFYNCGNSEGWQLKGWKNFIQEPFFLRPYCALNDLAKKDPWNISLWLSKKVNAKVAPDEHQLIIDYVNPKKKKASQNPLKVAELLRGYALRSAAGVIKLSGKMDPARYKTLAFYVDVNTRIGIWNAEEILAGIDFYSCYFSVSCGGFLKHYKNGLKHLQLGAKQVRGRDPRTEPLVRWSGHLLNWLSPYDIEGYISDAENALSVFEKGEFPFGIFRMYLQSRMTHNEIRRDFRPHELHSPKSMAKAGHFLDKALALGNKCLKAAEKVPQASPFLPRIEDWNNYLVYEKNRLKTGVFHVKPEGASGVAEYAALGTDHCFNYGDDFWNDFTSFFIKGQYLPVSKLEFSLSAGKTEIVFNLTQSGCSVQELEKIWDNIIRTDGEFWFLRLQIAATNNGKESYSFMIAPRGRYILREKAVFKHRQHLTAELAEQIFSYKSSYKKTGDSWTLQIRLPYEVIGAKQPKPGDIWQFNVISNPASGRKQNCVWQAGYETGQYSKPGLSGKLLFRP